ncbi:uncharacterized protein LOC128157664 isoform X3 [Crassostrea angulata]|uniref:uncharacterized protein LOC128157664 isoform X3 n=1 Tax=Magallana angulata TaxID=2784310 RepID=UPI0022B201A6|nr:uncharacterized protein LOC128157664 isoform X3 [Crassostrea angulata]
MMPRPKVGVKRKRAGSAERKGGKSKKDQSSDHQEETLVERVTQAVLEALEDRAVPAIPDRSESPQSLDGMTISEARSTCRDEFARLLLLTSDRVYDFAVWFIKTYSTGSLYVQGSRETIFISEYFDNQGREMKDLKWSSDGKYIRLNTDAYRLEATPGTTDRGFICQRGQL